MEDNQYEYQGIQFIGKLSSEIYRRGYIYFTKRLVPFDINYIQLLCLISLYIKDNQSQEQITDEYFELSSDITQNIDRLNKLLVNNL